MRRDVFPILKSISLLYRQFGRLVKIDWRFEKVMRTSEPVLGVQISSYNKSSTVLKKLTNSSEEMVNLGGQYVAEIVTRFQILLGIYNRCGA